VSSSRPTDDIEVPFDVERLVFFSDAVFAIAITLLVIELAVPEDVKTDADLREALRGLVPGFFSFALTFAVTALWWLNHHRLLRVVDRTHAWLVALNFVLLASIAFLPFASGLLGHHGDLPTAVVLYAATNSVAALSLLGMRVLAERMDLLRPEVDLRAFRRRTIYPLATAVIFLVSIPVAFVSSLLAMASWALVFVVSMVRVWDEHRRQARAGPGEP
jgi:uncharacterized membrane protein